MIFLKTLRKLLKHVISPSFIGLSLSYGIARGVERRSRIIIKWFDELPSENPRGMKDSNRRDKARKIAKIRKQMESASPVVRLFCELSRLFAAKLFSAGAGRGVIGA